MGGNSHLHPGKCPNTPFPFKPPTQKIEPSPRFPAGKLVEELPIPKTRVHAANSIWGPQSSSEDSEGLELEAGWGATECK